MEWSKTTQFAQKYGGKRCENTFTMATCTQTVACICLTLGWFVRMLFGTSRTGLWCARKVNFQSTVRAHRLRTHIPEEMIEKGWPGICTFMIRYKGTGSSTTDGSSLEQKDVSFYLFIYLYLFIWNILSEIWLLPAHLTALLSMLTDTFHFSTHSSPSSPMGARLGQKTTRKIIILSGSRRNIPRTHIQGHPVLHQRALSINSMPSNEQAKKAFYIYTHTHYPFFVVFLFPDIHTTTLWLLGKMCAE